jgi:cyclophilin family peptidyl-prolyl cis-trans isomerase
MRFILCLLLSHCSKPASPAEPAKPMPAPPPLDTLVELGTSHGTIVVKLDQGKAPITTANFLAYVDSKFYEATVFHRVIPGFMIQGGGYDVSLKEKPPREMIKNEAHNGLTNKRGTIAMARTNVPDSATSQFFINVVDNPRLDHRDTTPSGMGYCVFGEVVEGMEVVDRIAATRTTCPSKSRAPCDAALPPGMMDVPADPVLVQRAQRR